MAWSDRTALAAIGPDRAGGGAAVPFLVALGERLQASGGDGTAFLPRVKQEHPDDFWAAVTLARALQEGATPRPRSPPTGRRWNPGGRGRRLQQPRPHPYARRDWHEASDCYQKALEIDRGFAPAHNNLGLA